MRRVICALLLVAGACGGSDSVAVRDAWVRALPGSAPATAVYMTLVNGTDTEDHLVAVESSACGSLELHETTMSSDGTMSMHQIGREGIPMPPGRAVVLESGGIHVMCLEPSVPLTAGTTIAVTLRFDLAEPVSLEIPVEAR